MATPPSYNRELLRERQAALLDPRAPITARVHAAAADLPNLPGPLPDPLEKALRGVLKERIEELDPLSEYTGAVARGARLRPVSERDPASYARAAGGLNITPKQEWLENVRANVDPETYARIAAPPPMLEEPTSESVPRTEMLPSIGFAPTERGDAPVTKRTGTAPAGAGTASRQAPPKVEVQEAPAKRYKGRMDTCTRSSLIDALAETGGNKRQAAKWLGMSRAGFYKALERVGLPTASR